MGNGLSEERIINASKSGILVASGCDISSWKKVLKAIKKLSDLRGMALDNNKLSKPIPSSVLRANVWATLRTLDISANGLKCACVLGHWGTCKPSAKGARQQEFMSSAMCPLEVLNLSNNSLLQLPPLLLCRFPKLQRLLCRGNCRPLDVSGGLLQRIGPGANLKTLDLGQCGLFEFYLIDEGYETLEAGFSPFPSLRELFLDENYIDGTFALVSARQPMAAAAALFSELKNINLEAQQRTLACVDPSVYTFAPRVNVINVTKNEREEVIMEQLRNSAEYKNWSVQHKDAVTKQIMFTGAASLI